MLHSTFAVCLFCSWFFCPFKRCLRFKNIDCRSSIQTFYTIYFLRSVLVSMPDSPNPSSSIDLRVKFIDGREMSVSLPSTALISDVISKVCETHLKTYLDFIDFRCCQGPRSREWSRCSRTTCLFRPYAGGILVVSFSQWFSKHVHNLHLFSKRFSSKLTGAPPIDRILSSWRRSNSCGHISWSWWDVFGHL